LSGSALAAGSIVAAGIRGWLGMTSLFPQVSERFQYYLTEQCAYIGFGTILFGRLFVISPKARKIA
jgi:hypothetical protein